LYYKHNDMVDLKRTLDYVREKDRKNPSRKLNRRFIITEGIFQYHGDIAPLDTILQYKKEYKYRVILDDSLGIGVLGNSGRGTPEHFGIPVKDIECYCCGLDHALGTSGGFCAGTSEVVDGQRLSGAGYCFSASAPPYSSTTGLVTLQLLGTESKRMIALRHNAEVLRKKLATLPDITVVGGVSPSPLIHIRLQSKILSRQEEELMLADLAEKLQGERIAVFKQDYIPSERNPPRPSLPICVSADHTEEDINQLARTMIAAFSSSLQTGLKTLKKDSPPQER